VEHPAVLEPADVNEMLSPSWLQLLSSYFIKYTQARAGVRDASQSIALHYNSKVIKNSANDQAEAPFNQLEGQNRNVSLFL
jgi:hypothetical protein